MCQVEVRTLCNPSESCHVRKVTRLVARPLSPDKSVRLRYEDYVTDPKGALHEIAQIVALDLTEVVSTIPAGGAIKVGHNIAGNHLLIVGRHTLSARDRTVEKQRCVVRWTTTTVMDIDGLVTASLRLQTMSSVLH
jgi:hypothetical protein